MKKILLSIVTLMGLAGITSAQYVNYMEQALILSQQNFGSTARSKAMGNAFGALGGDFSSLSINPAGIGIYQRPELSLSSNVSLNNTQTTYQGQTAEDHNANFNFRNFGYVFAQPSNKNTAGLLSFNYAIGYNRLNSFSQNVSTQARNSPYSRSDAFAHNSNGITSSQFFIENNPYDNVPWESKLAWENYLIDVTNPDADGIGNQYASFLQLNEKVNQFESINHEGYINEYIGSIGANFNHQLYLGATIGIHDLYYNESRKYSETGGFGEFDYMTNARTTGTGYNLKFGIIYRPTAVFRIGLAIHTPTFYSLKSSVNANMSSNLQNVSDASNGTWKESTPTFDEKYKLQSPFRVIGSLAYQFGKKGLISLDYESVNYSKIKMNNGNDNYDFSAENQEINTIYKPVSNIRIGGELKATDALSLRVGYELFGNPNKPTFPDPNDPRKFIVQRNTKFNYNTIDAGFGYRINNVCFDLSYSLGIRTNYLYTYHVYQDVHVYENDNPILLDIAQPVKYHSLMHELVFTIGIKL